MKLSHALLAGGSLLAVGGVAYSQSATLVSLLYNGAIVSPSNPFLVSSGPYQFTSAGAMQPQLAVVTGATTSLTVPSTTLYFDVCVRSGAGSSINYTVDGSTPTTGATGNGKQLNAGQCVGYSGKALASAFLAIAATATTAIDVEYLK